jgi:hypothetical protein
VIVELVKMATLGGIVGGLVSHSTAAKPTAAAETPDVKVNHGRARMLGLGAGLLSCRDLSDLA